ncbi:MAG: ArsR/SmtB family transcription factor [Haloferacaceae archaeon]
MEKVLWYLLVGTRGGENRARIIRALDDQPRNANQLAEHLDLDYNTVRYHLNMLIEHDVLETSGDEYGSVYFVTDAFRRHEDTFSDILDRLG